MLSKGIFSSWKTEAFDLLSYCFNFCASNLFPGTDKNLFFFLFHGTPERKTQVRVKKAALVSL